MKETSFSTLPSMLKSYTTFYGCMVFCFRHLAMGSGMVIVPVVIVLKLDQFHSQHADHGPYLEHRSVHLWPQFDHTRFERSARPMSETSFTPKQRKSYGPWAWPNRWNCSSASWNRSLFVHLRWCGILIHHSDKWVQTSFLKSSRYSPDQWSRKKSLRWRRKLGFITIENLALQSGKHNIPNSSLIESRNFIFLRFVEWINELDTRS